MTTIHKRYYDSKGFAGRRGNCYELLTTDGAKRAFYSYNLMIAFLGTDDKFYVRDGYRSMTTSKHRNMFIRYVFKDKDIIKVPNPDFDILAAKHGISPIFERIGLTTGGGR